MLDDLKMMSRSLGSKIDEIREHLDLSVLEKKIAEKETETCSPDFWNDREKAEAILNDLTAMKRRVESWNKLFRDYDDILELIQMAESDDDPSWQEGDPGLDASYTSLEDAVANMPTDFDKKVGDYTFVF